MRHSIDVSSGYNRAPRKGGLTVRGQRVVVIGLLGIGAVMGKFVDDKLDAKRVNEAQPACAVLARSGDEVGKIKEQLAIAGEDAWQEPVAVSDSDGNQRRPTDIRSLMTMGLMPGDTVSIEHVDPAACQAIGGHPQFNADVTAASVPAQSSQAATNRR